MDRKFIMCYSKKADITGGSGLKRWYESHTKISENKNSEGSSSFPPPTLGLEFLDCLFGKVEWHYCLDMLGAQSIDSLHDSSWASSVQEHVAPPEGPLLNSTMANPKTKKSICIYVYVCWIH